MLAGRPTTLRTVLLCLGIAAAPASALAQAAPVPNVGEARMLPGGPAKLTFHDEFNGTELNRSVWTTNYTSVLTSLPDERQIYTPDSFTVHDGILSIRTERRDVSGFEYTSGAMTTFGSFIQAYGYFEVHARVKPGNGLWPAFWLLPWDKSWPPEIDVMEFLGRDRSAVYATYFWTDPTDGQMKDGKSVAGEDWTKDYHVFAVDWRPGTMTWYIDGREVHRLAGEQVTSIPMFMLLNTAIGGEGRGSWAGPPDASTPFPSTFDIDWVRAWQYDALPATPAPKWRYLTTTANKVTAAPGETVIFEFGLQTSVAQPPLIIQPILYDSTGTKQIARADFRHGALPPGRYPQRWPVQLPADLPKGLYALGIGIFTADWKPVDYLSNARTILVQ